MARLSPCQRLKLNIKGYKINADTALTLNVPLALVPQSSVLPSLRFRSHALVALFSVEVQYQRSCSLPPLANSKAALIAFC